MNNIVETYLTFKVDNIIEYIKILAEEKRITSKIPRQLDNLIYKYYNLFILSNKEVNIDFIKTKTGLEDSEERLILFYLLIEFDMTSKTELTNPKMYEFYSFLVNSIIIFIELEKTNSKNKEHYSYDESIKSILKSRNNYLDKDFISLINNQKELLSKYYDKVVKISNKFKELFNSDNYLLSYTKVKNSENLYFNKFKYKNIKLDTESKKDVELINNEFAVDLNFINIEISSYNIIRNAFMDIKKNIFIFLEEPIICKKVYLNKLEHLINLRCLKERIYLIIDNSLLDKYEDNISYLQSKEYNICLYKNVSLVSNKVYKDTKYLLIDYNDNLNDEINFANECDIELIINVNSKLSKEKLNKISDRKYIIT